MTRLALLALIPLLVGTAWAEPRPAPRPDAQIVVMSSRGALAVAPEEQAPGASVRPVMRLGAEIQKSRAIAAVLRHPVPAIDRDGLVRRGDRPSVRDDAIVRAMASGPSGSSAPGGGGICSRSSLVGEAIAPVPGPGACGIPDAVRITQVAGLGLSRPARMDCTTARALDDWVRAGVLPAVGRRGGGAVALKVAAGYSCRTRNNQPGAKISEHGRGHAIDISGVQLADGTEINVLRDWNDGEAGRILRAIHRAACGPFGTVLGPESDRFHRDHFHFDTARYRSGPYCR